MEYKDAVKTKNADNRTESKDKPNLAHREKIILVLGSGKKPVTAAHVAFGVMLLDAYLTGEKPKHFPLREVQEELRKMIEDGLVVDL